MGIAVAARFAGKEDDPALGVNLTTIATAMRGTLRYFKQQEYGSAPQRD